MRILKKFKRNSTLHKRPDIGIFGCSVLAILAFCVWGYLFSTVAYLNRSGLQAEAMVTRIEYGPYHTKIPVVRFTKQDGFDIEVPCFSMMFINRVSRGERVRVLYSPIDPGIVMIDDGPLIWEGPIICTLAVFLFSGLGAYFHVLNVEKKKKARKTSA